MKIAFSSIFLLCFFVFIYEIYAQNLIPNNGFEIVNARDELENWNFLNYNKPELIKEDSIIPVFKGNRSVGLYLLDMSQHKMDNRTFLQVKLIKSLKKGKKYRLKMYCKLSAYSTHSSKSFGAIFTSNEIKSEELKSFINNRPQLLFNQRVGTTYVNSKFINSSTDLMKWNEHNTVKIDVIYTAKGNEKYITIGNFFDGKSSFVYHLFNYGFTENTYIYYIIDEISLVEL
jgi:hypothetical protein